MKICEYCNKEHDGSYGTGRFCNSKCSHGFSGFINNKGTKNAHCILCGIDIIINKHESIKKCRCFNCKTVKTTCLYPGCNIEIISYKSNIKKCCKKHFALYFSKETRKKLSIASKLRCSTIDERKRMGIIGRKGGFGKKGYTKNKTRYDSNFEKECFEFLENNNIKFIPHKYIPNSSKISDIYLNKLNLWIELDGINREYRKKWLAKNYLRWKDKLKLYKNNNLNYKIFYKFDEFKNFINNNY